MSRRQAVDGHLLNMILPIFAGSLEFFTFWLEKMSICEFLEKLFERNLPPLQNKLHLIFPYEAKGSLEKKKRLIPHIQRQRRKERSLVLGVAGGGSSIEVVPQKITSAEEN